MLTGKVIGRGVALTATGLKVPFRMIDPTADPANVVTLGAESKRWKDAAVSLVTLKRKGLLDPDVARRSQFVDEVLAVVSEQIRLGKCCNVLAQAEDGRVIGALEYNLSPPDDGHINLLGLEPASLAGTPGAAQLRGVGTSLVAATSQIMLSRGVNNVYIHPLDEQAALFWSRRGFGNCGRGGLMCVRGQDKVRALMGSCQTGACDDEICVVCGTMDATEAARLPAMRRAQ